MVETSSNPVPSGLSRLGRAEILSSSQVQLISVASRTPNTKEIDSNLSHKTDVDTKSKRKGLLAKVKDVTHTAKDKTIAAAPVLADTRDTVSEERLVNELPKPEKHSVKDFLHHPASTIQAKFAGQGGEQIASNLVASEISHGTEVALIRAQDEVLKPGTESEGEVRRLQVETLIRERQNMFVRWTMDRHVNQVRILPVETVPRRSKDDFKVVTGDQMESMDWEGWARHSLKYYSQKYGSRYIGYGSSAPIPSKETMMPAIERLIVSSAPFQTLIMSIRRVYRWENRAETLKYLFVYVILWVMDLVGPGFFAAIVYLILHRRICAPSIEDLRIDIKRIEDSTETAMTLSELIEKKGNQNWFNPLLEDVGPWLMVQLADLANLMETLRNFYEWRVPLQTAKALGFITTGLLAVTLTPNRILIRLATLMSGITFFALFPIGSRFPEYRLLASPVKWLLWNIPTHAEWAIITLQAEGQRHRDANSSSRSKVNANPSGHQHSPTSPDEVHLDSQNEDLEPSAHNDYGSYSCSHSNKPGKLILNATGVRFITSIGHKQSFSLTYAHIERLEKIVRPVSKGLGQKSGEDLKICGPGGVEFVVSDVRERDQAFSQIVGFSGERWQVVW